MEHYNVIAIDESNIEQEFEKLLKYDKGDFIQKSINKTPIFRYFLNYLKIEPDGLNIRTIVVEEHYTCQSYLEDYVNYYARCYTPYKKYCKRIHFFSTEFNADCFYKEMLQNSGGNWDGYKGCMVIKPQPKGVFGITYLNQYGNNESAKRHYTCLTQKKINLFGHEYIITTMPFMEQDGIVASCATTALWMAFQTAAGIFGVKAPSLSEITMLAGDTDSTGKLFPSRKLELSQVCRAINNNGLISEIRTDLTSSAYFKQLIYSYAKGNIPILLNLKIEQFEEMHLVTVRGYRFDENNNNTDITYTSDKINKIYVHDGQIGPFARISIVSPENNSNYDYELITPWWEQQELHEWIADSSTKTKDPKKNARAVPVSVVIPLAPEIKITYDEILEQQRIISFVMERHFRNYFVWDVFLMKSNEYKKSLIEEFHGNSNAQVRTILLQSLPKYIWVIQARLNNILVFDYIYDSIELNKSGQPFAINIYNKAFLSEIKNIKEDLLSENESIKKTDKEEDLLLVNGFDKKSYNNSYIRHFNEIPFDMNVIIKWLDKEKGQDKNWETLKTYFWESQEPVTLVEEVKKLITS